MMDSLRAAINPNALARLENLYSALFVSGNEFDSMISYTVAVSESISDNGFTAVTNGSLASFIAARSTVVGNWAFVDGDLVNLRDESPRKQNAANLMPVI